MLGVLGGYPVAVTGTAVHDARADRLSLFDTSLAADQARRGLDPTLLTAVINPASGAVVSGKTLLDGGWAEPHEPVTLVFQLEGGHGAIRTIAGSTATGYGYIDFWHSTDVPDGYYSLRTHVTTSTGRVVVSDWVPIRSTTGRDQPGVTTSS